MVNKIVIVQLLPGDVVYFLSQKYYSAFVTKVWFTDL